VDLGHAPQVRRVELSPEKGSGAFLVVPRPSGWTSRLAASQPGHVEYWMRHYQVLPTLHRGISVRVSPAPRALEQLLASPPIPFAAGGFLDGVFPDWNDRSPYRCSCLQDPDQRWYSISALLDKAESAGAMIVVLPELTLDETVRRRLSEWLRDRKEHPFALVVAGSFHETDGTLGEEPLRRGISRALDRWGEDLLVHVKLRPMRAMPDGKVADEDLTGYDQVELLLAPFGLTGVAICLDFCEIGDTPVTDLWRAVGPALMLVPSMGGDSTNHAHRDKARQLALQHGTATVVASQHPKEPKALGLCWYPTPEGEGNRAVHDGEGVPVLYGSLTWTTD
jgi:predicted amidohydrolase